MLSNGAVDIILKVKLTDQRTLLVHRPIDCLP